MFLVIFWIESAHSKILGSHGQVFQIQEMSILKFFEQKLRHLDQEGVLKKKQQDFATLARNKVLNPPRLKWIHETVEPREFFYNPTYVLERDIVDHKGKVFHKAGTRINPFDHVPNFTNLVFVDGENSRHLEWLMRQASDFKIILIGGSPFKVSETLGVSVYFDQHGLISKKLGIKQVPATVKKSGKRLKIKEIKIQKEEEKNHAQET